MLDDSTSMRSLGLVKLMQKAEGWSSDRGRVGAEGALVFRGCRREMVVTVHNGESAPNVTELYTSKW